MFESQHHCDLECLQGSFVKLIELFDCLLSQFINWDTESLRQSGEHTFSEFFQIVFTILEENVDRLFPYLNVFESCCIKIRPKLFSFVRIKMPCTFVRIFIQLLFLGFVQKLPSSCFNNCKLECLVSSTPDGEASSRSCLENSECFPNLVSWVFNNHHRQIGDISIKRLVSKREYLVVRLTTENKFPEVSLL